ncbi:MAG: glyoxalase [Rubrivivax sp.]|nr:MAG: glyoxalase [Rubrivivax sp.]
MSTSSSNSRATVVPCLRYRDAHQAIDWLCAAFGFERHAVHANADGSIAHAQLSLGNGMIMLGSVTPERSAWSQAIRQPDELGGVETQAPYLVVDDADEVYRRALAAGATVVIDIKDEDYGGRGFTCRDLEGRLWSVGTYEPWAEA